MFDDTPLLKFTLIFLFSNRWVRLRQRRLDQQLTHKVKINIF